MSSSSRKIELAKAHLKKAGRRLERARRDLDEGFYEDAVIRSYYAIFHAAKACLTLKRSYPKTHDGVVSEFGRLFVRTRAIEAEYGAILSSSKVLRERGEYDVFTTVDRTTAEQKVDDAEKFLARIRPLILEK